jgi:uncharacterized iron-regulated protein
MGYLPQNDVCPPLSYLSEIITVATPAIRQLEILQRSLYERAFQEAQSLVAGASKTILAYSAEFERSLPRRITQTNQTDLIEEMRQKRFILYGDFHTLRQSQRGLLRILRAYSEKQRSNKIIIALEMFKAIDQPALDAYLSEEMDEEDFLSAVSYHTEWGFPWQNFRMILDYAKQKGIRVIGINSDNAGRDSLKERDIFAAEKLADAALLYPDHKIMCLIGEYHLADKHLPQALKAELKRKNIPANILRILNNIDEYYFKIQHDGLRHASTEYLKLKKDLYCIMNSPPWMKWKSFSLWEELQASAFMKEKYSDFENNHDYELSTDDHFDIDFQFLHFIRSIAEFIGVSIDSSDIETFHVHYSPDGDFYNLLINDAQMDEEAAYRVMERASFDGIYFLPKLKKVLITYISINNLAEAAGQFLHAHLSSMDDETGDIAADFYRRIIKSAAGMVGSKILNPRRKCWELNDAIRFVKRHKGERLEGAAESKRQLARSTVTFHEWMNRRLDRKSNPDFVLPLEGFLEIEDASNYALSRMLGQMIGINIYRQVITNKEPPRRIRKLFKHRTSTSASAWQEVAGLFKMIR